MRFGMRFGACERSFRRDVLAVRRKRILVSLPVRFCVRAFLRSGVAELLTKQNEVLIASPLADDPDFQREWGADHISFLPSAACYRPARRGRAWRKRCFKARMAARSLRSDHVRRNLEDYRLSRDLASRHGAGTLRYRLARLKHDVGRLTWETLGRSSVGTRWLGRMEQRGFWRSKQAEESMRLVRDVSPDVVVCTAPHQFAEAGIMRAAEKLGIPRIAYVLSFDNVTTRPPFASEFDLYLVWNEMNRQEVLDLVLAGRADDSQVQICGPLQFDFYARRDRYVMPREQWLREFELDPARPVVLYAEAGIPPQEPEIVAALVEGIRRQRWPAGEPQILVRCHPRHTGKRWRSVMAEYPEVRFSLPNGRPGGETDKEMADNVRWNDRDMALLVSTLEHCDATISVSSTISLDSAYFGKPSICPTYDERPGRPFDDLTKQLYEREHFVPIVDSGGVVLTDSTRETVAAVREALANPEMLAEERRRMLQHYDPFMDGQAHRRTAEAILRFLEPTEASLEFDDAARTPSESARGVWKSVVHSR